MPTSLHHLKNFSRHFDNHEIRIKRDDLRGLEVGGNKIRKLEYLVGDAVENGCDMLVTIGTIQCQDASMRFDYLVHCTGSSSPQAGLLAKADEETRNAIHLLAETEGLIADLVYEAKAVRGLLSLEKDGYFESGAGVLPTHLGCSPAIHAYANRFGSPDLKPFPLHG